MGFTNVQSNAVRYIKILGLKKENPKHYFAESQGKGVEPIALPESTFFAKLIKIEPHSYEFEGKQKESIKFLFADAGEYYQLDISYNSISRDIMNSLLGFVKSQKDQGNNKGRMEVELSLYMNKEGFKNVGVKVNGTRCEWFFSPEDRKGMIERIEKRNGDVENDYFIFNEKIKSMIPDIQNFIEVTDFIQDTPHETISVDDWDKKIEEQGVAPF